MSMDEIRVHVEDGGEHGKVGGNAALETNNYLWIVHESWCRATPPPPPPPPIQMDRKEITKGIHKKSFSKTNECKKKKEPTLVPCKNMTHQRMIFY